MAQMAPYGAIWFGNGAICAIWRHVAPLNGAISAPYGAITIDGAIWRMILSDTIATSPMHIFQYLNGVAVHFGVRLRGGPQLINESNESVKTMYFYYKSVIIRLYITITTRGLKKFRPKAESSWFDEI